MRVSCLLPAQHHELVDGSGTSRGWGLAVSTVDQGDQLYGEGRGENIMLQKMGFMLKICTI